MDRSTRDRSSVLSRGAIADFDAIKQLLVTGAVVVRHLYDWVFVIKDSNNTRRLTATTTSSAPNYEIVGHVAQNLDAPLEYLLLNSLVIVKQKPNHVILEWELKEL